MRVLKWPVPVDGARHRIGGGPVALVAMQGPYEGWSRPVMVWTIEADDDAEVDTPRQAQVYGTGMYVPEAPHLGSFLGSCVDGQYVWHVFAVDDDRWHEPVLPPKATPA